MAQPDSDGGRFERALEFVRLQHDFYAGYHHHKEEMAYAGFTLYVAAGGAAVFSNAWPPTWGSHSKMLALIAVTVFWIVVLKYLKFQLLRRRWAALRRAGCERLLARWIVKPPDEEEIATFPARVERRRARWQALVDYVYPLAGAVEALDSDQAVYPTGIAREWIIREQTGTQGIRHERLIVVVGWLLYVVLIIRTLHA